MDKNLASNSNSICKLASHYKKKKRKTNLVESLTLSQDVCDSLSIYGHIQAYKPLFYGHQQSSSVSLTLCGLPSLASISAQKNFLLISITVPTITNSWLITPYTLLSSQNATSKDLFNRNTEDRFHWWHSLEKLCSPKFQIESKEEEISVPNH